MALSEKPYAKLYAAGFAFGWSNIKDESMTFQFRDELFNFPAMDVLPQIAKYNGYFYTASVKELRALQKKKKKNGKNKKEGRAAKA